MLDIKAAVVGRLSGDMALAAMLLPYNGAPAIVADPAPADLEIIDKRPVVIMAKPVNDENDDTFSEAYRVVRFNVRVYSRPDEQTLEIDQAAEKARSILTSWPAGDVSGGRFVSATVSGPVDAPTDDPSIEGRLLQVRAIFKES
jgi:hypothetical protein